ncbi:unnamed protein product [Rhodiola kirilowii]
MSAAMANAKKQMRRMESKKSHSWWWDSHISPKNSKWLAENLEDMDQSVKRMLKLIDEDGDSFAKRAEVYYQRRPELVAHVEEFYRMYRALAERYDQVTGELRNSIPSDIRFQGSGISEVGSEHASTFPSSERKKRLPKSGNRAAGFEFFLGSGGGSSEHQIKENDSTSSSSDSESEGSSINNYSGSLVEGDDNELHKKIADLESELQEVKQKLSLYQGSNMEVYNNNGNSERPVSKIVEYEKQLSQSNLKIQISEQELGRLRLQLQKYGAPEYTSEPHVTELELMSQDNVESIFGSESDVQSPEPEFRTTSPEEELRLARQRLQGIQRGNSDTRHELDGFRSSQDLSHWEHRLELAQKDIAEWKSKFNLESREVSKLQERIARYKGSLSEREQEVRDLRNSISETDRKNSLEKLELETKMAQLVEDQIHLEEKRNECQKGCQNLKDEIQQAENQKSELIVLYGVKEQTQTAEIENLRVEMADRDRQIQELNGNINLIKLKHDAVLLEKDELQERLTTFTAELGAKSDLIDQMNNHLSMLHMEHMELITKAEGASKVVEKMKAQATELEDEVELQRKLVSEAADEKREAIRQLCLSIEHYRDHYHTLREAFVGSKYKARRTILAT